MLTEIYVEMWKDGIKVKAFLNVKSGISSKGSVGGKKCIIIIIIIIIIIQDLYK